MSRRALSEHYWEAIRKIVSRSKKGVKVNKNNLELDLINVEKEVFGKIPQGSPWKEHPETIVERDRVLKEFLYDRLKYLKDEKDIDISKLAMDTQHPLLIGATFWLNARDGSGGREKFVNSFDTTSFMRGRRYICYLAPLSFLQAVSEDSGIINRVTPRSLYNLESLLNPKATKLTMNEIDAEIDEIIPDLLSSEIIETIEEQRRLVYEMDSPFSFIRRLGKYRLPVGSKHDWAPGCIESDLDSLYDSREIRKEIYETVVHCMDLATTTVVGKGKEVSSFVSGSRYAFPRSMFKEVVTGAEMFGINQLLGSYIKYDGREVHESFLSRRFGLKPIIEGDNLIIEKDCARRILTRDSKFKNYSTTLPSVVNALDKFYTESRSRS